MLSSIASLICAYAAGSLILEHGRYDRFGLDAPIIFIASTFAIITGVGSAALAVIAYQGF